LETLQEACADTLEEIWASYNMIEKPSKGVTNCKKLRVLYLANNLIREWPEISKLHECPDLEEMVLQGILILLVIIHCHLSNRII